MTPPPAPANPSMPTWQIWLGSPGSFLSDKPVISCDSVIPSFLLKHLPNFSLLILKYLEGDWSGGRMGGVGYKENEVRIKEWHEPLLSALRVWLLDAPNTEKLQKTVHFAAALIFLLWRGGGVTERWRERRRQQKCERGWGQCHVWGPDDFLALFGVNK